MKTIFISFIISLFSICIFSQNLIEKRETILSFLVGNQKIYFLKKFNENNELQEQKVYWLCQNREYKHITDMIILWHGQLKDLSNFVDKCITFFSTAQPGTTTYIDSRRVEIEKNLGFELYSISPSNGDGYLLTNINQLKRIQKKIQNYL